MRLAEGPWYQRVGRVVAILFASFLVLGAFLDSISNALSLIKPVVTYAGTAVVGVLLLASTVMLKIRPLRWKTAEGYVRITRLGPTAILWSVGLVVLLWVPRAADAIKPSHVKSYRVGGTIWSEEMKPLDRVVVQLVDMDELISDTTDSSGRFALVVRSDAERQVSLVARKAGYETFTDDPWLGNQKLEIVLREDR